MYAQPVTRSMRVSRLLIAIAVCSVLAGTLLMAGSDAPAVLEARIAAVGPKPISGNVYASGGAIPAVGATVIATVFDGINVRATASTTTDSSGFYEVTFAPEQWDIGNIIVVGATLNSDVGEGHVIADDSPAQTVNITLGYAVPELDVPVVLVVTGLGAVVVLEGRKRRK